MISNREFDSIRPFQGDEIEAARERLCQSQEFLSLFSQITKIESETILRALKQVRDRDSFQKSFFGPVVQSLIHTILVDLLMIYLPHNHKEKLVKIKEVTINI